MRRVRLISFLLAALILPATLSAQRPGAHSMGGGSHAGGFRPSGPGPSGGFRSFAPSRPMPSPMSQGAFRPATTRLGVSRPWTGRQGPGRFGFPNRNAPFAGRSFGRNHFAYFRPWFRPSLYWGYPGYYSGPGYPWSSLSYPGFPEDDQSGEGYQPGQEEQAAPQPDYDDTLANQVQELTNQVAELQQQQAQPSMPMEARPAAQEAIPTVFAYRDGHQLEAQNYAIQGQTLWVFGDQITRKISLADLDLGATKRLNDSRGVDFTVPQ
jgi:hypothetical protein